MIKYDITYFPVIKTCAFLLCVHSLSQLYRHLATSKLCEKSIRLLFNSNTTDSVVWLLSKSRDQ